MPRKGPRKLVQKNENMPEMRSFFRVHETGIKQYSIKDTAKGIGGE
jgi:hypothetical protein